MSRAAPPPPRQASSSDAKPWEVIGKLPTKPVSEVSRESNAIAIFAKTGVGKTEFACSMLDWEGIKIHPDVGHPMIYVIDCDGGLRTVRSRMDQIRYSTVTSYEQALDVITDLGEKGKAKYFGGIVLDTGSELADLAMDWTLTDQGKKEPDWLAWRDNSRMYIVEVVRPLRNIARRYGIPVVFTFWEREETSDSGALRAVHADLNPALRKLMLGAVDLACWEEVLTDDVTRALHVSTTRRTDAKFRIDRRIEADRTIPPFICNPDLPSILNTIVLGKSWPTDGRYEFPDGLSPRFARVREQNKQVTEAVKERQKVREERAGGRNRPTGD